MNKFPKFWFVVLVLAFSGHMQAQPLPDFQNEEVVQRIAFGSCLYPRPKKVAIFNGILRQKPDVFIFLGDNIYGDTTDMELLAKKWNELGAVEGFKKLSETSAILATWDDHDYGVNDGGKSFPMRLESERIFLDFFKEPADSPRRKREGVYGSYIFGPAGKRCQILLLDTRSFRDELPHLKGKSEAGRLGWYEPTSDRSKSLLGEEQWKWLEEQLQVPADLRIIASSIQMLAHEKGMENWGNTPHELERLVGLLKKYKADHTFAISGDVHFAELSKREVEGYPFYDFTSSGMSHTSKRWVEYTNSFRVGDASSEQNAGLIEIDWDAKRVTLKAINSAGEALFSHNINLHDLVFPAGALAIPAHAAPQPNIVHILTDDLGWIDPAFAYKAEHGKDSVYETPNLDRLGANGTRFRQAYSPATTCAPSRAAYMAGQWPAHTGVYSVLGSRLARAYNAAHSRIDPFYPGRLPLDRPTIPQELKKAGYTTAHIQKWHFGGPGNGYPTPLDYGFDFGWDWKGQYNDPELWNPKDKKTANFDGVWRSMSPHRLANFPSSTNPEDPYCLDEEGRPFDAVSDLAVRWMDKSKDKPFFLNFCTAFVHSPFSTRDRKRLEHYCQKMGIPFPTDPGKINDGTPGQKNPYYAAMVDSLDWQVGQLLKFLETTDDPRNPGHKLIDNTYVVLSSDNGGLLGSPVKDGQGKGIKEAITDNRPLDGGKLTLEEGGIRIPFIVTGPGVPKGALNAKTPVGLVDMFPTFMAMAGAKPGDHLDLDGCNVLPVLKGESDKVVKTDGTTRDTLYFHFPSVQPTSSIIIKEGWKLRLFHGGSLDEKRPRVALYHLYNPDGSPVDESETKNLADEMPEKRDAMLADLQAWMKKFNAELPYKNAQKTGKPEPGSDRVPAMVSSKADGKILVTEVESGDGKSRIVDAKLVYTTNGSKLLRAGKNTEEWYQTPAKIEGARITVEAPPGMTHGVIYLRDENDFMIASEHLPPFSGSPDAISESAKGVDAIKHGFAWKPGLLSLIDAARAASASAAAKNLDHTELDAEITKAEKVAGQPAVEKTYAPAMRSLRQAIRALDVPEAKITALNWFPKNANW